MWKGRESDEIDKGEKASYTAPNSEADNLVKASVPESDTRALWAEKGIGDEDSEHTKAKDEKQCRQKAFYAPGSQMGPHLGRERLEQSVLVYGKRDGSTPGRSKKGFFPILRRFGGDVSRGGVSVGVVFWQIDHLPEVSGQVSGVRARPPPTLADFQLILHQQGRVS